MNSTEARELFYNINRDNTVKLEEIPLMEEAFRLVIRTAIIDNPSIKLFNTGPKFAYFKLCFNKIELELDVEQQYDRQRNLTLRFYFIVRGTFKSEDYAIQRFSGYYRRSIDELEFDNLVDKIIEIDEINARIVNHRAEKKEHEKRLEEKKNRITALRNTLEGKVNLKVNGDNSYNLTVNNASEEDILNLLKKIEEL